MSGRMSVGRFLSTRQLDTTMKDAIMTLNRFVVDIEKKAQPQKKQRSNEYNYYNRERWADGQTDGQTDLIVKLFSDGGP